MTPERVRSAGFERACFTESASSRRTATRSCYLALLLPRGPIPTHAGRMYSARLRWNRCCELGGREVAGSTPTHSSVYPPRTAPFRLIKAISSVDYEPVSHDRIQVCRIEAAEFVPFSKHECDICSLTCFAYIAGVI